MSNIPIFSYKQYLDDISKMTQQGTIGADRQAEAPRSAGSRGLKKVKDFIKDPVHMMGESEEGRPTPSQPNGIEENTPKDEDQHPNDTPAGPEIKPTMPKGTIRVDVSDVYDWYKLGMHLANLKQLDQNDFGKGPPSTILSFGSEELEHKFIDALSKIGLDITDIDPAFHDRKSGIKTDPTYNVETDTQEDIRKVKGGYRLVSKKTGRNLGTYPTRAGAEKRERQVQYFKHAGESRDDQSMAEVFESWLQRRIPEQFHEGARNWFEAKYQGRTVPLGKPMRGDVKKFKVYVKDPKTGNVKKVNFGHGGTSAKRLGQKTMKIKKSNPKRRKSFRARHNCANPGPRTKARYWSCRKW